MNPNCNNNNKSKLFFCVKFEPETNVFKMFLSVSQCRKDERKETKEHDDYVVGTFTQENSKRVGHVTIELYFLLFAFIRAHRDN